MALIRYRPNRKGIRALLGSEGVRRDLEQRAHGIAERARAAYLENPPHSGVVIVEVDSAAGETSNRLRSRAAVIARHPAVMHIEADRRVLGAALDGAKPKPKRKRKPSAKSTKRRGSTFRKYADEGDE